MSKNLSAKSSSSCSWFLLTMDSWESTLSSLLVLSTATTTPLEAELEEKQS
jgi:hypothetical protein